jgi:hypothetical protein
MILTDGGARTRAEIPQIDVVVDAIAPEGVAQRRRDLREPADIPTRFNELGGSEYKFEGVGEKTLIRGRRRKFELEIAAVNEMISTVHRLVADEDKVGEPLAHGPPTLVEQRIPVVLNVSPVNSPTPQASGAFVLLRKRPLHRQDERHELCPQRLSVTGPHLVRRHETRRCWLMECRKRASGIRCPPAMRFNRR